MTLDDRRSETFSVDATFVGTEAMLTVRGDIDSRTSRELVS
jgi:hypothetical protein